MAKPDRWNTYEPRVRDAVIFVVGVGGVINELFVLEQPRSVALIFLASLIGVPFVLGADAKRHRYQTEKGRRGE